MEPGDMIKCHKLERIQETSVIVGLDSLLVCELICFNISRFFFVCFFCFLFFFVFFFTVKCRGILNEFSGVGLEFGV